MHACFFSALESSRAVLVIRDINAIPSSVRSGAVAIGNFDGVHRGHAQIVARLLDKAKQVGGLSTVFTFDPHPVRLLRPEHAPPPLTWTDRKAELLAELGVHAMIAYPTDENFLKLDARQFFESIIRRALDARALVEGANFYFGRGREGTISMLRSLCSEAAIDLTVVEPVQAGGEYVSSSRVRKLVAAGQMAEALAMLTQPYRIRGLVTHGAGRGAKIGFPTANVEAVDTLLPGPGVYAGRALFAGGDWPAAINIGPNPTFGEQSLKVEVHLIGYHGNLYGVPLEVDFYSRLREIQRFQNVAELQGQLKRDVELASQIAGQASQVNRQASRILEQGRQIARAE